MNSFLTFSILFLSNFFNVGSFPAGCTCLNNGLNCLDPVECYKKLKVPVDDRYNNKFVQEALKENISQNDQQENRNEQLGYLIPQNYLQYQPKELFSRNQYEEPLYNFPFHVQSQTVYKNKGNEAPGILFSNDQAFQPQEINENKESINELFLNNEVQNNKNLFSQSINQKPISYPENYSDNYVTQKNKLPYINANQIKANYGYQNKFWTFKGTEKKSPNLILTIKMIPSK